MAATWPMLKRLIAAKAWALLQGRTYVTPEDVKSIGPDVLRHRLILTYEAEAQAVTTDAIIKKIFNAVPVPGGECRNPKVEGRRKAEVRRPNLSV